jgi:hypothetical protein
MNCKRRPKTDRVKGSGENRYAQSNGFVYVNLETLARVRRKVLVEGRSKRSVMAEEGLHWETLQKMLAHAAPPGYRQSVKRGRKIDVFADWVRGVLEADGVVPRKQRHSAKRIFDRLRAERGYEGGYTAVKELVAEILTLRQEVFVPLSHRPGEAQVDFGHALVKVRGSVDHDVAGLVAQIGAVQLLEVGPFFPFGPRGGPVGGEDGKEGGHRKDGAGSAGGGLNMFSPESSRSPDRTRGVLRPYQLPAETVATPAPVDPRRTGFAAPPIRMNPSRPPFRNPHDSGPAR